ncbi:MAG: pyroglutamyl-peptidase I family protein [Pseudomonadota bacterium]
MRVPRRKRAALVTGFEPFALDALNPSGEIARRLDGSRIAGWPVVGRILPVSLEKLDRSIAGILAEIEPVAVIALGLAAGETAIRLERVAVNLADFEIADNSGLKLADRVLDAAAAPAIGARLPLRAIQSALLGHAIPARLSSSAGTYLCNAAMFRWLAAIPATVPCGFIHLPYARSQVAATIAKGSGVASEAGGPAPASMELSTMRRAIKIALATTLSPPAGKPRPRA